jgi:hypothetical protein
MDALRGANMHRACAASCAPAPTFVRADVKIPGKGRFFSLAEAVAQLLLCDSGAGFRA